MKELHFLFLILTLCYSELFGQVPTFAWSKSSGGIGNDEITSVTTDKSGNIYIAGWFSSPSIIIGNKTLYKYSNINLTIGNFIVKYDRNGNIFWVKNINGACEITGICCDNLCNIYVTGFYYDTLKFGSQYFISKGELDIFTTKLDSAGNFIWARSAGGSDWDFGLSVTSDNLGYIYVTGNFFSANITPSGWFLSNTWYPFSGDGFIIKYDTSGNVWMLKGIGGNENELPYSIITDSIGNLYVTGYSRSPKILFDQDTIINHGSYMDSVLFIAKYNSKGNVIFVKIINGYKRQMAGTGIALDHKGNFYVTGYFNGDTLFFDSIMVVNPKTNNWRYNVFLAKYDTSGKIQWVRYGNGNSYNLGSSLAVDNIGNVYLAGNFSSESIIFGSFTLKNSTKGDTSDIFVVKYDINGNVIWALSTGGKNDDRVYSIALDKFESKYIVGCYSSSKITFGNTSHINKGKMDLLIAKIVDCNLLIPKITNIGDTIFCQGDSVQLISSPALSYLWSDSSKIQSITIKKSGSYLVTVSDSLGCQATSSPVQITVHPLPPVPVITKVGNDLKSTLATTYQWYKNDTLITNAASQTYTPIKKGNYKVEITDSNGCAAISDSFNYTGTGIFNPSADDDFSVFVYPNPTTGDFTITFPLTTQRIEIINTVGQLVQTQKTDKRTNIKFTLSNNGIYYIRFLSNANTITKKLIVNK